MGEVFWLPVQSVAESRVTLSRLLLLPDPGTQVITNWVIVTVELLLFVIVIDAVVPLPIVTVPTEIRLQFGAAVGINVSVGVGGGLVILGVLVGAGVSVIEGVEEGTLVPVGPRV